MADTTELIDMDELKEIMDDDIELIKECFEDFKHDATEWLASIKQAMIANDAHRLEKAAHKLKGSLKYLAAEKVADIAFQLESMAKRGDLEGAREVYDTLQHKCEDLKTFMDSFGA